MHMVYASLTAPPRHKFITVFRASRWSTRSPGTFWSSKEPKDPKRKIFKKKYFALVDWKIAFITTINEAWFRSKAVLLQFSQGRNTSRAEAWKSHNHPDQGERLTRDPSVWLQEVSVLCHLLLLHKGAGTGGQELRNMLVWPGDQQDRICDSEPPNTGQVCVVPRGRFYPSPDRLPEATVQGCVYEHHSTHSGVPYFEEIVFLNISFPSVDWFPSSITRRFERLVLLALATLSGPTFSLLLIAIYILALLPK